MQKDVENAVSMLLQAGEDLHSYILSIESIRKPHIPFWLSIAAALDMIADTLRDCSRHIDSITGVPPDDS